MAQRAESSGKRPALPDGALPTTFQQADQSSRGAQRRFLGATASVLCLVGFAALTGVIDRSWAGWLGAIAFLGAIVVGALAVTQNLERTWYDGRALAESAKSLTWLYVARGGDFAAMADPDIALRDRMRALRDELEELDFVVDASGNEVTTRMQQLRDAPLPQRRDVYLEQRVGDQLSYYRRRAYEHRRSARVFRLAAGTAQSAGLVGAALKGVGVLDIDVLGIAAATAAGFTAWLQTRDHVTLARAYRLTAEDLERVVEDAPADKDETEWAAYVADAEAAMSREHVMWLARRGRRRRP